MGHANAPRLGPFILVSHRLYRDDAEESRGFSGFFSRAFFEKWSYLPTPPAKIAGWRKILPGADATGKFPPDTIFRRHTKSMFNRKLLRSGTALAKCCPGKTPKEHCSRPERRDQNVL
jgi:hypothetical protein